MLYKLYHTFDAKHAKNLGEESVSDNVQAVLELVKNAYDGDATECEIIFEGVPDKIQGIIVRKIIIKDNGVAMSFYDISNNWLNIGTQNKIQSPVSPTKQRKVVGAKGIGHFACQKLGDKVRIISNPLKYPGRKNLEHIDKTLILSQDWLTYIAGKDFGKIPNDINIIDREDNSHGVTIEISELKQKWTIDDIEKIRLNIALLLLPPSILKNKERHDFKPIINAKKLGIEETTITNDVMRYAPYKLHGKLRGNKLFWDISRRSKGFERKTIKSDSVSITDPKPMCGDVDIELYHFPLGLKSWGSRSGDGIGPLPSEQLKGSAIVKTVRKHSGIKIYKDSVRIMPYGEPGDDWLGLEKIAASHGAGRIRNTSILGFVLLSSDKNPDIRETTTRQKLIANEAYISLGGDPTDKSVHEKSIMIQLIRQLEENWARVASKKKKDITQNHSAIAQNRLKQAKNEIAKLSEDLIPRETKKELDLWVTQASTAIKKLDDEYEERVEKHASMEELYRSLASFAITTLAFQHETHDPVRKIGAAINDLRTPGLPEEEKQKQIDLAWKEYDTLRRWRTYTNSFGSLAASTKNIKNMHSTIDFEDICNQIRDNQKAALIIQRGAGGEPDKTIKLEFIPLGELRGIHGVPLHFWSIFNNMITNSVKALKSVKREEYKITITASKSKTHLNLEFTDNGKGIAAEHKDNIWRLFYTSYTQGPYKGMGMGLPITKDIVEIDYDGEITLDSTTSENDNPGEGKTKFLLKFPLNQLVP